MKSRVKLRLILFFLVFFVPTTVFSFGGVEKKLSVYTTLDEELARNVFNSFTKETGISIDWVRLSTGEAVARLEAEKENPRASVWYGGVGLGHIEAKQKGLTVAYQSPEAQMPEQFRDSDYYWSGIYAGPLCFESNTQMLEKYNLKLPTAWMDLIDPMYEGHIQMANPGSSGTAYNVVATLVQIMGEDEAFAYLRKLDKNITQYTRSGSAPGKSASIGEVAIAIGYAHDAVRLVSQGYPLRITFPSEGTGYEIASISLINNAPKDEEQYARQLYDWALGEKAAKIYAKMFVVPFLDVPLAKGALPISEVKTIRQDDEWAAVNKMRLVERWNAVIGEKRK